MRVSSSATFLIGELKPATSQFRRRYALSFSIKSSALVRSPVNIVGAAPSTRRHLQGQRRGVLVRVVEHVEGQVRVRVDFLRHHHHHRLGCGEALSGEVAAYREV